ncbi:MAG TPA: hypothetical protein VEQ65_05850 [Opitutus sp.]|nr:hypothetical protein [Opitutus sp.]
MDEELASLEAELRRLRPIAPAARLARSIDQELAREQRLAAPRPRPLWWLAFPIAAAAAVVVALVSGGSSDPAAPRAGRDGAIAATPTASPVFRPIAAETLLLAAVDEGLVTLTDGTPARRVRESSLDVITWKNTQTNASLRWTVPREEVRVVPVAYH